MKNKKKFIIIVFAVTVVLQIAVIAGMIGRFEVILATGKEFKFRTEPVDPYDAFRGRYVALDIKESNIKGKNFKKFNSGERVYAIIATDKDGFAKFAKIQHAHPGTGIDYLKVKARCPTSDEIDLDIPFDRFYMKEDEAQLAEDAYRENSNKNNTYITVRIKYGYGVIENLFIDGKPVREYIAE